MDKTDEKEKKSSASRGRIMQVVEVEDEDLPNEKADVSPEIVPEKEIPSAKTEEASDRYMKKELEEKMEEKPNIADSFPVVEPKNEKAIEEKVEVGLNPVSKRDIVSELFETKDHTLNYPEISMDKKSSPFGFIIWVVLLLAIVGLIGGGLLFIKNRQSGSPVATTPTITPSPTVVETPTPEATPSGTPGAKNGSSSAAVKNGISIQVLNGSGKSGVASTMKKFLEEKGYTVVGTGNAKNFDYAKTEILVKSSKSSVLTKLETDLSPKYTIGNTSSDLEATASYDAQVIIGKE